MSNQNQRKIIYVDASGSDNNKKFKISLYDKLKHAIYIMDLGELDNSSLAEKYAIFYAIFYIQKHQYNNCMILSDNKSAVTDKIIMALSNDLKINISWIPREINEIADKVSKMDPTLKDIDLNILKLFIHISNKAYSPYLSIDKNLLNIKIENLEEEISKKNSKINNQKKYIANNLRK